MRKLRSWSDCSPILRRITFTWSVLPIMFTRLDFPLSLLLLFLFLHGDSGKHDPPWNKYLFCWNSLKKVSGFFYTYCRSSKMMQPKLHMSAEWSYCFSTRDTSGARYHLDPTWIDMYLFIFFLLWRSSFRNWAKNSYLRSYPSADNLYLFRFCAAIFCDIWCLSLSELTLDSSVQLWGSDLDKPKSQILALQSD